jgi:hypothetical protein
MTRIDRLKEYADPTRGPQGAGRDEKNLAYWQDRASENSQIAPRARKGEMKLADTGKKVVTRDTAMKPMEQRKIDRRMAGRDDPNNVGSNYLPNVRRDA